MITARCWFGPCADLPAFHLVPSDPALRRPEASRNHLGGLIVATIERSGLEALTVERIPPDSLVDDWGEEPPRSESRARQQRHPRFTEMQEVTRPDRGHGLLVAMYRYRVGSPEAIGRVREIALAQPCPSCPEP